MISTYDFDTVIDRRGSCAVKLDWLGKLYGRNDVAPLWVADMDFAVCPEIMEAFNKRFEHPVLGYFACPDSYWDTVIGWLWRCHGFKVEKDEISFIPGVVRGIGFCINRLTQPGDKVIIQPPVYHPFRILTEGNERIAVENPLIFDGESYRMDFEHLENLVNTERPKLMILCNPHNPIGIQWDAATLAEVARICHEGGVRVVSDEIHGDLMLNGGRHIPFLSVSEEAKKVGIMLGAPSKTFNIPGLVSSWIVIKDPSLREELFGWLEVNEFSVPYMTSVIGAEAAYKHGEEWLKQALKYIEGNIDYAVSVADERSWPIKFIRPQASFLIWADCRALNLPQEKLMSLFVDEAKIAVCDGAGFGNQGNGFVRINIASPRSVLADAFERLDKAIKFFSD